ncbi:MAG: CapA family protein [Anaerolineaceae bacterium]|nr:CapA family protein [Anaerolineaceae bacterium]
MLKKIAIFQFLFLVFLRTVSAEENYHYYTIACPFTTVTDVITMSDLWNSVYSQDGTNGEIQKIWLSSSAFHDLKEMFTVRPASGVWLDAASRIAVMEDGVSCALIPLKEADPSMKLVRLEHARFPWDDVYDPHFDSLAVPAEESNFDRNLVSRVLLTGTTALARTVAYKMAQNGSTYPAEMIRSVFDSADITHISNESSIWSLCPDPVLDNVSIQFCSGPEAIEVFDFLGVDVVELTGNHLRDFDWMPLKEMLDLLDEKGYRYYGAGRNAAAAAKPLFMEHNGNQFVFLGCNCAGPEHVYATVRLPGVRRCDFDRLEEEIHKYAESGYQVIVTLQYYELYSRKPSDMQKRDFQRLSDAGAVVVSGSQSHFPQIMLPGSDRFIHYGLGNLFFDQMDVPVKGTRQEFLDRYIFYDGRLLNVQLVTALLTDYSRPRLMTDAERQSFLKDIYSYMR